MKLSIVTGAAAVAAGCVSATPKDPEIAPGPVPIVPALAPTPWWTAGDAACPPLQGQPRPGGPPGTSVYAGRLVGAPQTGDVHCEAGGVAHGPATGFHPDGHPALAGITDRGYQVGTWTTWYPTGAIATQSEHAGAPAGPYRSWYPSGTPHERGVMKGNARTGVWLAWDDGGGSGAEADRWVQYDDAGRTKSDGAVHRGELVKTEVFCIVGMTYPLCRVIPLVELGMRGTTGHPSAGSSTAQLTFELGAIVNIDRHQGVGLSAGWVIDADYPAVSVRGRYRRWLYDFVSVEASAGILTKRGGVDGVGKRGVSGEVAFVLADIVAVTATVERYSDDEVRGLAGFKIGFPGILGVLRVAAETLRLAH